MLDVDLKSEVALRGRETDISGGDAVSHPWPKCSQNKVFSKVNARI